ncbi:MAG: phage major capsid protein [Verrucomicrobiota bacterium]
MLKKLLDQMEAKQKEIEGLAAKIATVKDEEKPGVKSLIKTARAEFDTLKEQFEEAKTLAESRRVVEKAKADITPDMEGKTLTGNDNEEKTGSTQVGSSGPDAKARDTRALTLAFLQGKRLGNRALDAIALRDTRLQGKSDFGPVPAGVEDVNYEDLYVRLPREWSKRIFGKAMLSTDATGYPTDSGLNDTLAEDFKNELIEKPKFVPNVFDFVRHEQALNGRAVWPMSDKDAGADSGVAFTWKSTEGADKGETDAYFKDFEVSTNELSGYTELSLEALRRPAIQLEAKLIEMFRRAARREFARVILDGTGVNQPLGIRATGSGATEVARATAGAIGWADLVDLEFAIAAEFAANGRYSLSRNARKGLVRQVDGDGRPLFSKDVSAGMALRLNDQPYLEENFETGELGTSGEVIFGDFMAYMFAMEADIAIARSDHAAFKKGRVVYRLIAWVGGKPIYGDAFALLGDSEA